MSAALTDAMLWQCLDEAEQRQMDNGLPLDVRIRSMQTYTLCLRAAHERGYDYASLRDAAGGAK